MRRSTKSRVFSFFFNDTATTEIYTLSLHDALPICLYARSSSDDKAGVLAILTAVDALRAQGIRPTVNLKFFFEGEEEAGSRSEEHTSELKSRQYLVCRLLLDKKIVKSISRMPSSQ